MKRSPWQLNWMPQQLVQSLETKRGKTAKKVKDVKKIAISFTIVKNITAKTGERTLYIRIAKPDNDILTKNPSNTFPYENRSWFIPSRNTQNTPEKNKM